MFRFNIPNCRDISHPVDITNSQVKELLNEKILSGVYKIGELIIPQTFEKVIFRDNQLVTEDVVVRGRRISLKEIREDKI